MEQSEEKRSWIKRIGYRVVQFIAWSIVKVCYGARITGLEHVPETGATLLCPNHQSHLDPPLMGCLVKRRLNFMAKKSLFKYPPLNWLITFLDSIPVSKEGLSADGIKATLKCLKRHEAVLIFPEGARTFDGKMQPLLPGFAALARRTRPVLVPAGIAGAYRAWPRTRSFPIPGPRIRIVIGPPILPAQYESISDEELTRLLEMKIRDCVAQAQTQLGQTPDP